MNTTNNIKTANTNTVNTTGQSKQAVPAAKTNWMIDIAGLLFWIVVFFQFMFVWHDMVDKEFTDFVIYNALPLIGALAYLGIRKEQKTIADRSDECLQKIDSDC